MLQSTKTWFRNELLQRMSCRKGAWVSKTKESFERSQQALHFDISFTQFNESNASLPAANGANAHASN
jgi:hypothetical protein